MKRFLVIIGVVFGLTLITPLAATAATAPACQPTGYVRDGINLTAALINPGNVTKRVVKATGCNIGVYYGPGKKGNIKDSVIYGANYYGVVNRGATVNIETSKIHDIGEVPFNGTQHGVAIYFVYDTVAKGTIKNNMISRYQKGGIVVNGAKASATIEGNKVTGLGRVDFIAQNGIQLGYGAKGSIKGNMVKDNAYTGAGQTFSAGLLVFGGCGDPMITNMTIQKNLLSNNDVGIYVVNNPENDDSCTNPPSTPTKNMILENSVTNNAVTNTTGYGDGRGYQAGITEYGNGDTIKGNFVSGAGYQAQNTATAVVVPIDTTGSLNVILQANYIN